GQNASATLPVTLTLGNVLPRRLSLVAELPVLRGSPTSSFRFRLTLKNESDQEFLVNLNADTPRGFSVTFTTLGQEVASLPINGSAPARNVTFSASEPTGWEVKFTPERADEIPANGQAEVTASLKPSDKSLSGDYMVTMTASAGDASGSADFRITVGRSTLWGFAGVLLIAVALGVVTFAVNRYGRR